MPELPDRMTPEQRAALERDRLRFRSLNAMELLLIERAHHYCAELIKLAIPRGRLAGLASRADLSSAAKRLLTAIEKLEQEMEA